MSGDLGVLYATTSHTINMNVGLVSVYLIQRYTMIIIKFKKTQISNKNLLPFPVGGNVPRKHTPLLQSQLCF